MIQAIREREAGKELFLFLQEGSSSEALYYRWRTYAFVMGNYQFSYQHYISSAACVYVATPTWPRQETPCATGALGLSR